MFWFVVGIILLLGFFAFLWASPQATAANEGGFATGFKIAAWVSLFLGIFCIVVSCTVKVSTKNVGIETTFGATSGEVGNGLHPKWPWEKVTEMDAAIQTDTYVNDNCLKVRIANQQTACVYLNFQWRINPLAADELFRDYRTFDHVRDALVTRRLTAVVNEQLADYNPLNSVSGSDLPQGQKRNPSLTEIATAVNKQMDAEIGIKSKKYQIEVLSTIIPLVKFDDETQGRINQLQQQIALTRVAQQSLKTANAQAKANKALAASVSNAPNVLVSHCYSILETMVKNHESVPAGFSCWPGGNLTGVIASPNSK